MHSYCTTLMHPHATTPTRSSLARTYFEVRFTWFTSSSLRAARAPRSRLPLLLLPGGAMVGAAVRPPRRAPPPPALARSAVPLRAPPRPPPRPAASPPPSLLPTSPRPAASDASRRARLATTSELLLPLLVASGCWLGAAAGCCSAGRAQAGRRAARRAGRAARAQISVVVRTTMIDS